MKMAFICKAVIISKFWDIYIRGSSSPRSIEINFVYLRFLAIDAVSFALDSSLILKMLQGLNMYLFCRAAYFFVINLKCFGLFAAES